MKIENVVTFTRWSEHYKAHYEQTTWLQRPYRLTLSGAQRIIRRETPTANAVRIEYLTRQ